MDLQQQSRESLYKQLFLPRAFRRNEEKILLLPGKVESLEEQLTVQLSAEYSKHFSRNLLRMFYGDEDEPREETVNPEFLINRIWDHCLTAQQRVDMLRDCLYQIEQLKRKKLQLIDKDPAEFEAGEINFGADPPKYTLEHLRRQKLAWLAGKPMKEPQAQKLGPAGSSGSQQSKKELRLALKRRHFHIKKEEFLCKERHVHLLQSIEKKRKKLPIFSAEFYSLKPSLNVTPRRQERPSEYDKYCFKLQKKPLDCSAGSSRPGSSAKLTVSVDLETSVNKFITPSSLTNLASIKRRDKYNLLLDKKFDQSDITKLTKSNLSLAIKSSPRSKAPIRGFILK